MARLVWGQSTLPEAEGVDRGVLYLGGVAVPWNGLVSITENYESSSDSTYYFDGVRYLVAQKVDDFSAEVEAITYPPQLEAYESQFRFDLSYRVGTAVHLVYGVLARPQQRSWTTLSGEVGLSTFAWDISTVPDQLVGERASSHLVIETRDATEEAIRYLEELLYGSDELDPIMPSAADVVELILEHSVLRVTDHGDGTWTAVGPDSMIALFEDESFTITSPSAIFVDIDTYTLSDS